MSKKVIVFMAIFLTIFSFNTESRATESEATSTENILTDSSSLSQQDQAVIKAYAEKSGKTIEEVQALRIDKKMGWGEMAKELGLHPSLRGQIISDLKRSRNLERKQERIEKRQERNMSRKEAKANGVGRGKNK